MPQSLQPGTCNFVADFLQMENISDKIKILRNKKGLSQEELAERSSVNLRTIQRIEKGVTKPRSSTLTLILEALGVKFEDIHKNYKENVNKEFPSEEKFFYLHISILSFVFMPFGNIILPYFLWKKNKDLIADYDRAGINLLNYQILWSVFYYLSGFLLLLLLILKIKSYWYFFYPLILLWLINIILPVYFAIKSKNNNDKPNYPVLIKFLQPNSDQ